MRLKDHLGLTCKNVAPCSNVHNEVKQEIIAYLKKYETDKQVAQQIFDEKFDSGLILKLRCRNGNREGIIRNNIPD